MYVWSQLLGGYFMIFFAFGGRTGFGSASLKLCVYNAASPWSHSLGLGNFIYQCQYIVDI